MGAAHLVQVLKEENQDFEFYPTTDEILACLFENIGQVDSLLDIGAGNGKLLRKHREWESGLSEDRQRHVGINNYYAIEKSSVLINELPPEAVVLGVDFDQNTLLDKQTEAIFCNPPYSVYEQWTERIINEAYARVVYLVIPQRWKENKRIMQAIERRDARHSVLGSFDFLESEDRKARAKVDLVEIALNEKCYHSRTNASDPFDIWFKGEFGDLEKEKTAEEIKEEEARVADDLVRADDPVKMLVELYCAESDRILQNYRAAMMLDASLLSELGVNIKMIREGMKKRMEGLKLKYWKKVFSYLDEIKERFTQKTKEVFLERLFKHSCIDFNESNIRAVLIWVIKNANLYYDKQVLDVYDRFANGDNIKAYKSNQHFINDGWRYIKDNCKYTLEYRIIQPVYHQCSWRDLSESVIESGDFADILVVAKNLGFDAFRSVPHSIETGTKYTLYFKDNKPLVVGDKLSTGARVKEVFLHTGTPNPDGKKVFEKDGVTHVYDSSYAPDGSDDWYQYLDSNEDYVSDSDGNYVSDRRFEARAEKRMFAEFRIYQNNNLHVKFNKDFMRKLNVEAGRLKGWIKSPQEAAEEFDVSVKDAQKWWKQNHVLLPNSLPLLGKAA